MSYLNLITKIGKAPFRLGKKGVDLAYQTGRKCLDKFGKVPTAVGITAAPTLAAFCLTSGNPLLMSIFAIPGSMTGTALATSAITKGILKTPKALKNIMCKGSKNYTNMPTSIFMK